MPELALGVGVQAAAVVVEIARPCLDKISETSSTGAAARGSYNFVRAAAGQRTVGFTPAPPFCLDVFPAEAWDGMCWRGRFGLTLNGPQDTGEHRTSGCLGSWVMCVRRVGLITPRNLSTLDVVRYRQIIISAKGIETIIARANGAAA